VKKLPIRRNISFPYQTLKGFNIFILILVFNFLNFHVVSDQQIPSATRKNLPHSSMHMLKTIPQLSVTSSAVVAPSQVLFFLSRFRFSQIEFITLGTNLKQCIL
jgi:hypothetical protein